jgi:hypothetical protein
VQLVDVLRPAGLLGIGYRQETGSLLARASACVASADRKRTCHTGSVYAL